VAVDFFQWTHQLSFGNTATKLSQQAPKTGTSNKKKGPSFTKIWSAPNFILALTFENLERSKFPWGMRFRPFSIVRPPPP
jgi:hypothetical protein